MLDKLLKVVQKEDVSPLEIEAAMKEFNQLNQEISVIIDYTLNNAKKPDSDIIPFGDDEDIDYEDIDFDDIDFDDWLDKFDEYTQEHIDDMELMTYDELEQETNELYESKKRFEEKLEAAQTQEDKDKIQQEIDENEDLLDIMEDWLYDLFDDEESVLKSDF